MVDSQNTDLVVVRNYYHPATDKKFYLSLHSSGIDQVIIKIIKQLEIGGGFFLKFGKFINSVEASEDQTTL